MENRGEEYVELSDSELSTSFPDKGVMVVQALVYKRGEKRRPEFLLNHGPYTAPLRRFLRLLLSLVEHEGTDKYDTVLTTMTCLINNMERNEVNKILEICGDLDKLKPLFFAIPTNTEWSDKLVDAFSQVAAQLEEKSRQCLDFWNSHSHSSPMYWEMPSARLPEDLDMDDAVPIACQAVLDQAGFHVRAHPIIKPVSYLNEETRTRFTVCLCQITGEDKQFEPQETHRMFFPLAGALQHLRDPIHPHTPAQLRHFHNELYNLDRALYEKRQAARRASDDNSFICSPSPLSDDGRKRRMSSSSETSDGRSPKSPCTKSPIYRKALSMRPPPSFSGGVKPIIEMPSVNGVTKDPRLKSSS